MKIETIFEKAKEAKRESKYIEFKEEFNPDSKADWCEIIKDIVAMANSGGGCILIGVKNDGTPSKTDLSTVEKLDPAQITDKMAKYTNEQFCDFEIREFNKQSYKIIALVIGKASYPIVFVHPGTYQTEQGKQKTAFGRGTVYFRHGAKSEPANFKDLEEFFKRKLKEELKEVRKYWLKNIRKVVDAPQGYKVFIQPPEVKESNSSETIPIRLIDDPNAQACYKMDPDKIYPYRRKEIIETINKQLPLEKRINQHDVLCIKNVYNIEKKAKFYYKPKFGSPQYSHEFVEWILEQYNKNPNFFEETRRKFKELQNQSKK